MSFTKGDIVVFDEEADSWSMFFDASQAGLGTANIDGFHIFESDNSASLVEMSFSGPVNLPGVGLVDDSDVVTFSGTTGSLTSGTFALTIDGSDVGLSSGGEDIDAVSSYGAGYAFSTSGSASIPRTGGGVLSARNEDLVMFAGTTGNATSGTFDALFDGSDLGFQGDLRSVWIDPDTSQIFGSAISLVNVGGFTVDADDVFVFTGTTGSTTSGTFSLFFDGDQHRFGGEQIDGLHIEPGTTTNPGSADLAVTVTAETETAVSGDTVRYAVEVTNGGPDAATNVVVTSAIPAGLTAVSTSGCAADPNGLPCSLGTIPPNATTTFMIESTVDIGVLGTVTVSAEASSSTADPNPTNNADSDSFLVSGPPLAVADGPMSNSSPGALFHTEVDTTYDLAAAGVLANDTLGSPSGSIASFGGGDLGGSVTDNSAGQATTFGAGSLQVNSDGSLSFTPDVGYGGPFNFKYRLTNPGGFSDADVTIYVGPRPVAVGSVVHLSSAGSGTVDGITFDDEDIVSYNTLTDTWAMFIDGSDIGLGPTDINGFTIETLDPTPIVQLTFTAPITLPGIAGRVDDSDVVTFVASTTGETTAGTFSLLIDGSDVRLSSGGEDIDALARTQPSGDLVLSTWGSYNTIDRVSGSDEDLLQFTATGTGPVTSGTFSLLFDGSDVDLTAEDISGAAIDPVSGNIYAASLGGFDVPGLSGDINDIFVFSGTTGTTTSGTFSTFFDGDAVRFSGNQINALHVSPAPTSPVGNPPMITTVGPILVDENQTSAVDVDATDPDGETENGGGLAYAFAGGVDDTLFNLDTGTGVVTFLAAPDFENPGDDGADNNYNIRVTVTDTGALADTADLVITVQDVDENTGPMFTNSGSEEFVNENETFVFDFEATDDTDSEDNGLTYTKSGGDDAALFELDPDFGILSFIDPPDFENPGDDGADNRYEIEITVTDSGGLFDSAATTVVVEDVDENAAPTITSSAAISIPETQTIVVDLVATDDSDSEGSGLVYSKTGGTDQALFELDTATGDLKLIDPPDFEIPSDNDAGNDYEIQVTVTDSGLLTDSLDLTVTVTDVSAAGWAGSFGSNGAEEGWDVVVDAAGNVYTTGSFQATVDFDPGPGEFFMTGNGGGSDVFVSKLDSAGQFQWAKSFIGFGTDQGFGIALDASGNVYTTGSFDTTVDFDPGPGTFNMTSAGSFDAFVSKLDSNGNFVWARQFGNSLNASGFAITIDGAGDVYTIGDFNGTVDFDPGVDTADLVSGGNNDIFIVKLDTAGDFVWAHGFGGIGSDVGRAIDVDANDNVFATGDFVATVDFDPGAATADLVSAGNSDIFVLKLDSAGNYQWANRFGSTSVDQGRALAVGPTGDVHTTGNFRNTVDFDPGPATANRSAVSGNDIFVSKLTNAGGFVFANSYGGAGSDQGLDIAVDADGAVYSTGFFHFTVDFDSGASTANRTSVGNDDIFVTKLNPDGDFQWVGSVGSSSFENGNGIAVDSSGDVRVTGFFRGTSDFDPGPDVTNLSPFNIVKDGFILKWNTAGEL